MPRIPDFNIPSVQVQPVDMPAMQGPGVAPMQNAAPEQMQQMGQGMMQFGKGMADIGMRLQDVLNDSVVAEYDNKWRNILNDESVKFQSLQGRDAISGYKGFQENIAKQRRDVELGLTNEAQKIAFRNMADRRLLDIDKQANFHVTKETYNFKVSETEARIQNMMDDAIDYGSKAYDPGVPPSVRMLDGTTGLISDKTVSAIVEGARKNNANAFQTRYSGLMNQARESLSFQGINPDDEQGKLLMRNLDQKLHTGVLDRMVKNNDTNSARMFLADKNLRDKVDPDYLYKVENTLATKRKEEFASDFARALFANPDLVTAQDKRNFARGAHQAGLLDNSDLTSVLQMVKTYEEEEKETKATRNVETLSLAKTWMRAQTQGMGFSSEQSVGNFVLQRSPDLYRALGEDGLTDLETWVRTGYKETTNPASIKQLYELRDKNPSAFKSLTPMQIKDRFQLSDSDEAYWLAQLNEANGTASAADNGVMTDKRRLDAQFIKEYPKYANVAESMMHTMADYRKWEANIDSEFIAEKSKPENKNLTFQQFLAKRNTEVIKDGEPVILASLEPGEVGSFRIEIPNSGGKSVDVLPTDVPAFDRAKIVDAIKESNSMRWRVGTISTDANGLPVFRVHTASDGAKSMHQDWASATDEAQKLGKGFIVQQAPEIPLDERSIISELMKQVVNRGEDPQHYFSVVRRRTDIENRIKSQGVSNFDEYMLKFARNPDGQVNLSQLVDELNLENEMESTPYSKDLWSTTKDPFTEDFGPTSKYGRPTSFTISNKEAFDMLSGIANRLGVEVGPAVLSQLPNSNVPVPSISPEDRRTLASQVRSGAFRKGSLESAVASFQGTDMSKLYGPFTKNRMPSPISVRTQRLSPIGKSLASDLEREIAAVKLRNADGPLESGESEYLQSLSEMFDQVMQGNNTMAEMWRTKIDTESKTYKSAFLNNLSK
jgi:hypothetical protein